MNQIVKRLFFIGGMLLWLSAIIYCDFIGFCRELLALVF